MNSIEDIISEYKHHNRWKGTTMIQIKILSDEKLEEFGEWCKSNPQATEHDQMKKYRELLREDTNAIYIDEEEDTE